MACGAGRFAGEGPDGRGCQAAVWLHGHHHCRHAARRPPTPPHNKVLLTPEQRRGKGGVPTFYSTRFRQPLMPPRELLVPGSDPGSRSIAWKFGSRVVPCSRLGPEAAMSLPPQQIVSSHETKLLPEVLRMVMEHRLAWPDFQVSCFASPPRAPRAARCIGRAYRPHGLCDEYQTAWRC